jgi:hypothetical protein
MLPFNLQFSRLDDVIHFYLRPPTLPHPARPMEEKSVAFIRARKSVLQADPRGWGRLPR